MSTATTAAPPPPIVYPDSDGKPMAENTKQFLWIQKIEGSLEALYRDDPNVFVAGDNLWYPVEGEPTVRQAPDAYVVFGRPKGHRGSYKQWEEGGVPLTVVFEILSPGNDDLEMARKLLFYDEYGVEEYYVYDPDTDKFLAYLRGRAALVKVYFKGKSYVSPRLGIRFDLSGDEMTVHFPDGRRFLTHEQLDAVRARAEKRADEASRRADEAERLSARLGELTRKVIQSQITPEERAELDGLLAR